jgi:hypothetical protein
MPDGDGTISPQSIARSQVWTGLLRIPMSATTSDRALLLSFRLISCPRFDPFAPVLPLSLWCPLIRRLHRHRDYRTDFPYPPRAGFRAAVASGNLRFRMVDYHTWLAADALAGRQIPGRRSSVTFLAPMNQAEGGHRPAAWHTRRLVRPRRMAIAQYLRIGLFRMKTEHHLATKWSIIALA